MVKVHRWVILFGAKFFKPVFHQFLVSLKIRVLVDSTRLVELFSTMYQTWGNAHYFVGVQFPTSSLDRNSKMCKIEKFPNFVRNEKAKSEFSCGTRFEKVIKNLFRPKTVFSPLERNGAQIEKFTPTKTF